MSCDPLFLAVKCGYVNHERTVRDLFCDLCTCFSRILSCVVVSLDISVCLLLCNALLVITHLWICLFVCMDFSFHPHLHGPSIGGPRDWLLRGGFQILSTGLLFWIALLRCAWKCSVVFLVCGEPRFQDRPDFAWKELGPSLSSVMETLSRNVKKMLFSVVKHHN